MDDNQTNFFSRFYDFVTGSNSSKDINFEHVRHKCEPGQKSFVSGLFERLAKRYQERRAEDAKGGRRCERQPATPKSKIDDSDDDKEKMKEQPRKVESCEEPADDFMPRCFIKEQNPLAPLCCEIKSDDDDDDDDEPCPPAGYPQNPRVPSCGCDRCKQSGYHGRCCDRRTFVQQTAEPPPRLEKA